MIPAYTFKCKECGRCNGQRPHSIEEAIRIRCRGYEHNDNEIKEKMLKEREKWLNIIILTPCA